MEISYLRPDQFVTLAIDKGHQVRFNSPFLPSGLATRHFPPFLSPAPPLGHLQLLRAINWSMMLCRRRPGAGRRSKAGCMTCRLRHKKCDETRPSCLGCTRNQLFCQWPQEPSCIEGDNPLNSVSPQKSDSPIAQTHSTGAKVGLGSCQTHYISTPGGNSFFSEPINPFPVVFRSGENRRLLDHFVHDTAKRMAGKRDPENPFLTYNLRIATYSSTLQHIILAITASHLEYRQSSMAQISRTHYGVALRGVKHAITHWDSCSLSDRVSLLASVLGLCWFEVILSNWNE